MKEKLEQFLIQHQTGIMDPLKWVDWGLPLCIPLVQWTQHQKAYTRELLIRDLLSFVTGTLVYLLALPVINLGIRKIRPSYAPRMTQFLASLGAVSLFIGFAGLCGPRLSQWVEAQLAAKKPGAPLPELPGPFPTIPMLLPPAENRQIVLPFTPSQLIPSQQATPQRYAFSLPQNRFVLNYPPR